MKDFICLYTLSLKIRKSANFLLVYILGSAVVSSIIFIHVRAESRSPELYNKIWLAQLSSLGCDS